VAHLGERGGARHSGRALGHHKRADGLDRTVSGLGDRSRFATERGSSSLDRVEGVGLAAASSLGPVRSVDLDDRDLGLAQELGQPRPIRAGALDAHLGHLAEGLEPGEQRLVAPRRRRERCGAEQSTERVQRSGNMNVEVRVDATGHGVQVLRWS
jgi:hypothetical protein